MTNTPQHDPSADASASTSAAEAAGPPPAEAGGAQRRSVQDDPRAKLALARKNHAASPTSATGAGHQKAANESSKQGKKEKKVRW